jgi:hypothetical protein
MADWMKYVAIIGGVIAVVGQFWPAGAANAYYLPVIGGVLAIIGGIMK